MKRLWGAVINRLSRFSPEVADHVQYLAIETYVALIHRRSATRCLQHHKRARHLKVNLGCGSATKTGFLNVDFSPAADVRIDLRRAIPLPNGSCSLTYSEHFVEHLSYPEGVERFFSECFRILEPGGEISIAVPDTEWPLVEYAHSLDGYLRACEEHGWHPPDCTTFMEHINYHFRQRWSGFSYSHFENHRFAWDFVTMKKKLLESGFVDVFKRDYDPALDSAHRKVGSLFVKAVRPRAVGEPRTATD